MARYIPRFTYLMLAFLLQYNEIDSIRKFYSHSSHTNEDVHIHIRDMTNSLGLECSFIKESSGNSTEKSPYICIIIIFIIIVT